MKLKLHILHSRILRKNTNDRNAEEAQVDIFDSRLRVLGLRIAKNDDDVMRFRREVLLEELKGSTMTADALCRIASFVPRLEKVFLDEAFNDGHSVIILDRIVSRSDNFAEAWKALAHSFQACPAAQRKLRVLSLPGCSINDEALGILAPSLVRVKKISLGRNPITAAGWHNFKNCYVDAASVHEAALTHLWVSSPAGEPGSGKTLLHGPGAAQGGTQFNRTFLVLIGPKTHFNLRGYFYLFA